MTGVNYLLILPTIAQKYAAVSFRKQLNFFVINEKQLLHDRVGKTTSVSQQKKILRYQKLPFCISEVV